jgi:hypothetical protein
MRSGKKTNTTRPNECNECKVFFFPTKGLQKFCFPRVNSTILLIFWKFSPNFQYQKIGKKEKEKPLKYAG